MNYSLLKFQVQAEIPPPLFSFTHEHAPEVSQQVFRTLCRNLLIRLYTTILTESSVFMFTRR